MSPNLKSSNTPIRQILSDAFHLPIYIENDANAAALGEHFYGAAKNIDNFIFLLCGKGIGAGIIVDGKLLRGSRGYAGALGHIIVDPQGIKCGCGQQGCWETTVTSTAVIKWVTQLLNDGYPSRILDIAEGCINKITFENIVSAADQGDELAIKALVVLGEKLTLGIGNIVNVFDTELIILGGTLNLASHHLLPVIKKSLPKGSLASIHENVKVMASTNGADACLLGTVALVIDGVMIR